MKCKYCNGTGEHINDANRMTTCEFCGGTGEVEVVGDSVTDVCDKCGGTGFFCEMRTGDACTLGSPCPHQKPLTNEEWLCSLSTEEKAEFLKKIIKSCGWCLDGGNPPFCLLSGNKCFFNDGEFVEWLKEKHHD